MKSTIVITLVGIFALDAKGKIIEKRFFSNDSREAAERLTHLQRGELVDELIQLLKDLESNNYKAFSFEEKEIVESVKGNLGLAANVTKQTQATTDLRQKLGEISVRLKRFSDLKAFHDYTHSVTIAMAEQAISKETQRRDLHAIQAIRTLDDLDKTLNLFAGRLREWYGLHFPELDRLLDKHETYARLVSSLGVREDFTPEKLESEGLPPDKAKVVAEKARKSIGFAANAADLALLRIFSKETLELHKCRSMAEEYLTSLMGEVAPNMTAILGPLLSARLIAIAGSLDRLAKMPSSTLQILGAEKALFRSLKTGSRPPKHGIIFQYQAIHAGPRWQRGKIARTLSNKLSIAARIDAFKGDFMGDKLKEQVERRIQEIQEMRPPSTPVKNRK